MTQAYTANGQRDWVEDANGNRSDYAYDGYDRLSRLDFPVAAVGGHAANANDNEQYGYDANGNMLSRRVRSGETIAFVYDNLNRETLKDIPGGTSADVYSSYDLLNRRLSARFASASGQGITYTYDALSRVLSETESFNNRALNYQYDLAGNRTRVTYPDANYVSYTYDVLNRMEQVRENGATTGAGLLGVYSYDLLSRPTNLAFGNGTNTGLSYATNSQNWSYTQNLASTAQDVTVAFTQNPASQTLSRDLSNTLYAYTPPALSNAYTRDGLNQYLTVGGVAQTHDARGNLTNDGSRTLTYDLENRLTSASGPTATTLAYDPLGRLRTTTADGVTTTFLYSGDQLVAEYNGTTLLRRYAFGAGVDRPITWYEGAALTNRNWLHADELGSVIATSNNSGVATIYSYGPYGEPANDNWAGSRFRYTGQIAIPELRLYFYKSRFYSAALGRFYQTDVIGYEGGLNLYAYVGNDPLTLVDPTGTIPFSGNPGAEGVQDFSLSAADGFGVSDASLRRIHRAVMAQLSIGGAKAGDGSPRYQIDLREHEGVDRGHTIAEHVGKSDQQLLSAMRRPVRTIVTANGVRNFYRRRHGSFTSLGAANRLVSSTLSRNSDDIRTYLESGEQPISPFLRVLALLQGASR